MMPRISWSRRIDLQPFKNTLRTPPNLARRRTAYLDDIGPSPSPFPTSSAMRLPPPVSFVCILERAGARSADFSLAPVAAMVAVPLFFLLLPEKADTAVAAAVAAAVPNESACFTPASRKAFRLEPPKKLRRRRTAFAAPRRVFSFWLCRCFWTLLRYRRSHSDPAKHATMARP